MSPVEVFTIREAAEHCGVSYQTLRKRVDRGTVQIVKSRDGIRRIPRSELERVQLWPGSKAQQLSDSQQLQTTRAELDEALAELATLRPQLDTERETRERTEQAMHQHRAEAITAQAQLDSTAAVLEPLTDGGLISGFRALRALRRREQQAAKDNQPATV